MWLFLILSACSDAGCQGADPCRVKDGKYNITMPSAANAARTKVDGKVPALIYFHGYGGSPATHVGKSMETYFLDQGYAVVFPQGLNKTWAHDGSPSSARDEPAFMDQVRADILANFDVDPGRLLVSGFSQGGSMAWDLACHRPDDYLAFAPASGAFWEPLPASCDGVVSLRHTHGNDDTVVPMDGRPIGSYHQGDVYQSFDVMAQKNGCVAQTTTSTDGPETCQQYTCEKGSLELCTYAGKHKKSSGWNDRVFAFFEAQMGGD